MKPLITWIPETLFSTLALCTLLIILPGCSSVVSDIQGEQAVVVPYDSQYLLNLQAGREYAANGRYELAREHFLLALASSRNRQTRNLAAQELASVDLMIQTLR